MSIPSKKKVVIIAGPTAVGKTTVAIGLAKHFQTEIISADSRQCFKELNIGVARPSSGELLQVQHHFIASHSVLQEINAVSFEKYALEKTDELFKKHEVVIMVGGTGLYIKAFCEGLDEIPAADPIIREKISSSYKEKGLSWLQQQVQQKDPAFYKEGEIQNPQRMMRALEVVELTGQSILSFRKNDKVKRDFNIIKIGLELPKEELYHNISTRVDKMMEAGLAEEVKQLLPFKELNALQTVGYKELFEWADKHTLPAGEQVSFPEAIERIKLNTRQYARRQMTWFKKDKAIKWFAPPQINEMIEFAESKCRQQS
mgnify:FL=1